MIQNFAELGEYYLYFVNRSKKFPVFQFLIRDRETKKIYGRNYHYIYHGKCNIEDTFLFNTLEELTNDLTRDD